MLKVGNKLRKIRELKNITSQQIADQLDITIQGYSRIERDEVSMNLEQLDLISSLFEMKPEDVLSFDEKNIFNNYGTANDKSFSVIHEHSSKLVELYEDKTKLLANKIQLLEEKITMLEKLNSTKS